MKNRYSFTYIWKSHEVYVEKGLCGKTNVQPLVMQG